MNRDYERSMGLRLSTGVLVQ